MNRFGRTLAVLFCLILCLFSTACSGKAQPAAAPAQLASLAQTLEALTDDAGDPLFADPRSESLPRNWSFMSLSSARVSRGTF